MSMNLTLRTVLCWRTLGIDKRGGRYVNLPNLLSDCNRLTITLSPSAQDTG